jgi:Ca-activated chloride channel family protein
MEKAAAGAALPLSQKLKVASKAGRSTTMRSAASWGVASLLTTLIAVSLVLSSLAQTPASPQGQESNPVPQSATPQNPQPGNGQAQPGAEQPSAEQPSAEQPSAEPPSGNDQGMFVFKKQVEEVVLHATVVDDQQRLVTGLDRNAFQISENGVPQTITSFRREDVPVEIGIVVDNSGSMRDKREQVGQAVLNLIRASNPQDQVFVVNFGQNPYLDQDFTSNVNLLQAALRQETTRGSTALYDAIAASDVHLEHNPRLSKKVLLVITDGQDNMSQETLQETLRRLQQPDGPTLYAIGLLGSGLRSEGRQALQELANATGGSAYFPDSLDQVDNITRAVAHDIRSQYIIAFRPQNQNTHPDYQSLRVVAHAPGYSQLTVRTRSGFYAQNPPAH